MGIEVPNVIFLKTAPNEQQLGNGFRDISLVTNIMRDFAGMKHIDDEVKSALLDFSFNLTLGKLDEAYRAVKAIDSPAIWENMAHMCVKTKRLDVAEVCLGHMGHARGAAALRESLLLNNSDDVSVGVLAIQLGLIDDAARLFREAGKYHMLNELYQASGLWEKAIKVATEYDHLHIRTTYYHYAQHLESVGNLDGATLHYENSQTFRTEVPRMYYSLGKMDDLENYVHQSNDMVLLKWWAAYLESKQKFDKARKYYAKAGDHLSLVRILCFQV
jgi:intraflagellar transport protein 140